MRRMWAVTTATLCLVLSGVPVAAQSHLQVHDEAVIVTATQKCDIDKSTVTADGAFTMPCTLTASDPRVTGPLTIEITYDVSTPNDTGQGILAAGVTLQGPDGNWSGQLYQTVIDATTGPARVLAILAGDGAYEGWVYVSSADNTDPIPDYDSVGVIFQGPLPPSFWP